MVFTSWIRESEGNYRFDRLKTHIPNYLYQLVRNLEGYNAISYATLRVHMANQGITEIDLKRFTKITSLGHDLSAD